MLTLLNLFFLNGFSPLKGFRKLILKNGFTVHLKSDKKLPIISVQLWVRAGSIDETDKNNGISHFLEHIIFRGTENYSVGEISRIVESHGGQINAATSNEFTFYYIDISTAGFIDALKIMADIAQQKASLPGDEVERERLVILEEIKRSEDDPEKVLYENFNKQLFTITPYKRKVIGETEIVSKITKEDIISYYKKYYIPDNMVLVIAGNIDYKNTVRTIHELFGKIKKSKITERKNLIEPVKPPSYEKLNKNVQQSYILAGFLGPKLDDEQCHCTADILSIILGSGRSSRLYRNLRETKQLVYSIGSGFYSQLGTGAFVVSAVCAPENVDIVKREISSEFDKIINEEISQDEFNRAKEIVKSNWYFEYETYHGQAQTVGYWSIANKLDFVKKYLKNIDKVNYEDIKKFLKIYYTGLTVSVVNPLN